MEAYKPYVDYITNGGVAETAYILSKEGALCGTNLPIQELPKYNFDLVDAEDPNKTHNVIVDERANLIDALHNKGVCKNPAGIRLYNQKYYTVRYDEESQTLYLKKVPIYINSGTRWSLYLPNQKLHSHRNLQHRTENGKRCPSESRRAQQESRKPSQRFDLKGQLIVFIPMDLCTCQSNTVEVE